MKKEIKNGIEKVHTLRTDINEALESVGKKHKLRIKLSTNVACESNTKELTVFKLNVRPLPPAEKPKNINHLRVFTLPDLEGHFIVATKEGRYYQRHGIIAAFVAEQTGQVFLDLYNWAFGHQARRGIQAFLGEPFEVVVTNLESGQYHLATLNKMR